MAVVGLSISIFFFTSVLFLGDSIDASVTNFLTSSSDTDINLSSPSHFFDYEHMSAAISSSTEEYAISFPRITLDFLVHLEERNNDVGKLLSLDFSAENAQNFGFIEDSIMLRHQNFTKTIYQGLPRDWCIISDRFSERNQLNVGGVLLIEFSQLDMIQNYTVVGIYKTGDNAGLGIRNRPDILVDLPNFWSLLDSELPFSNGTTWVDKINNMIIDLEPESELYTFDTLEETQLFLQDQGAKIITAAQKLEPTIQDWTLEYNQLENTRNSKTFQLLVSAMTFFVGLSAVFLSSTLIYSTMTTSLNDRIREFGIQRTIGASKYQILLNILLQGVTIGFLGAIIGSMSSTIFFMLLRPILMNLNLTVIVIQPINILYGFSLGLFISILVAFLPARYVYKMSLIRSLYPDRYIESNVSSKVKEKNPFLYLFIIGSVLSLVGLFVFVSLPNIMISGKYDLLLNLMSVALFCVMIGFILLGLSLLPLLIHVALLVSTPLIRNIKNFLNMSIFRHNRRNQLINLMLIFSFSMIIFTSSFITNVTNQMITQKQLKTGTSMFIKSTDKSLLPMEIKNDLMEIEGVESTSAILRTIKEDGYNYPGSTPESQDLSLSAGDLGGLSTIDIFSVAVDEDFKRTIYQDIIQMEEGDFDHAFESLFNLEHPSAIIAEKLATSLDVSLNDSIRLLFKSNQTSTETIVKITGIFHQIPGVRSIEEFGSLSQQSFDYLSEDGILVSLSLFNQGFGLTSEKDNQGYASRILVKVRENADENAVKSQIYASLSEVNIEIITTTQWISQDQNLFSAIKYGVSLLLLIFIFTAVSNLSVSAYSIFVERQAEIRSLRGIGLSIKNVEHVFFIELLILLLANGFVGVIAGGLMALTFSSLGEVVYRVKTPFTLSYDLIIILFIISISYLKLSYHRLFRQKIEMKISSNLTI